MGRLAVPSATSFEQPTARKLGVATVALALLIAWLPLQTPVALIVFQYGHAETIARAMLLAKDAFTILLIAYFFVRYWPRLRFYWFDWAAIGYVALIGVYSIVPWLLGSHISFLSVAASARELAVLGILVNNISRIISKAQIEEHIYDWSNEEIESNTIEVYISSLRRKLGKDLIKTVRGLGYMISP